jgi:ATP-binding cassette subfamily E protein 1
MEIEINLETPIQMGHSKFQCQMRLQKGKVNAFIGPNGIGKSSFMQFLKLNSKEIFEGLELSFCSQFPMQVLGDLTCRDLLTFMTQEGNCVSQLDEYELINAFQFTEKLDRPINQLSGGENQVLKLLACFLIDADVYLCDEPSAFLDRGKLEVLVKILEELKQKGKTIILIDHGWEFLHQISDEILEFYQDTDYISVREYGLRNH